MGIYIRCAMNLIEVYQCFCDRTRLRILHLLAESPLCVCHFQDVLAETQVKISKHLAYLRSHGMVTTEREQKWNIYSLKKERTVELDKTQVSSRLRSNRSCIQTRSA